MGTKCPNPSGTAGQPSPTDCGPGNYQDDEGKGVCKNCEPGFYCPVDQTEYQLEVTVGYYSGASANERIVCPEGFYCPTNSTSLSDLTDKYTCPEGLYCKEFDATDKDSYPVYKTPTLKNNACPSNHYCLPENGNSISDNSRPIPCPVGTFGNSDLTGLTSDESCPPCDPGKYCAKTGGNIGFGAVTIPVDCEAGYYCEIDSNGIGTTRFDQYPCPAATYRSNSAANSEESCSECTGGYYCPNPATQIPEICTEGNYCPPGVASPTPCPKGTFSDVQGLLTVDQCTPCTWWFFKNATEIFKK